MDFNKPIGEQLSNNETFSNVREKASSIVTNIGDSVSNAKEGLNGIVSDYSSSSVADVGSAFLDTNSLVAKFVFLIVVLISFFLLMNLGIYLISWFATTDKSPYIFKGIYNTNIKKQIRQDPKLDGSKPIYRSNNEDKGIEFTWSSWLKLDQVPTVATENRLYHIYNKGSEPGVWVDGDRDDSSHPNYALKNCPGLYVTDVSDNPTRLQLNIKIDTLGSVGEEPITIQDLPIQRWFHLAIRLQNKIIDVYVNGTITTRVPFTGIPEQNYGDVFVGYHGYNGSISNLRYFDSALSVFQISNIVMSGPNLKNPDENRNTGNSVDYLSSSWYTNDNY
jgi:hypothetical protein